MTFLLQAKHTYLFKLNEKLDKLADTQIHGRATAKSSVGRVDVLARLIVDRMDQYEYFDSSKLPSHEVEMFLEISPITFKVRVKAGKSLSQLRLFYCHPDNCRMEGKELCKCLLRGEDGKGVDEPTLSVDLSGTNIIKADKSIYQKGVAAFMGKGGQSTPIDLWEKRDGEKPNPSDYWECIEQDRKKRLLVKKECFYILRSKERLYLPEGIAVYCRAIDESLGEMRIHYAGFAHPFFGKDRKDNKIGTPLIFEVRGHNVDVNLVDGEKLARLQFYRMSKDCAKKAERTDKQQNEKEGDVYNEQELRLSKLFGDWGSPS